MRNAIGKYCVVRTRDAGVHCGIVENAWVENGLAIAELREATRLWRWTRHPKGSLSLSSVSLHGGGEDSQIDKMVPSIEVCGVIEFIPCSSEAEQFLRVPRNHKE